MPTCSPRREEAVILDLSDFDAPAGTPLADALDLNDIILEIDNKSMTNRPDLWGHYGIARELAALYHLPMKTFPHFDRNVENTAGFRVTVEDAERCPRMIRHARSRALSVKPAPYWMQSRIWKRGYAAHQRAGGHHQLRDAGHGPALPRLSTPTTSPVTSSCAAPAKARS